MEKVTKPYLVETVGGGFIDLPDGVRVRWQRHDDGRWEVTVESDSGLDILDVRKEAAGKPMAVH